MLLKQRTARSKLGYTRRASETSEFIVQPKALLKFGLMYAGVAAKTETKRPKRAALAIGDHSTVRGQVVGEYHITSQRLQRAEIGALVTPTTARVARTLTWPMRHETLQPPYRLQEQAKLEPHRRLLARREPILQIPDEPA